LNVVYYAVGKYKVEVFDKDRRTYVPTPGGLGMHVEVRDPDEKTIMSRVSHITSY